MDKHCLNANFISLVKCTRQRQTETLQQASCFLKYQRRHALFAKRKVMEAAFNAAIMYGCESWLATDKLYSSAVKCLLGVRINTANDIFEDLC